MILYNGKVYPTEKQKSILAHAGRNIRNVPCLTVAEREKLTDAADILSQRIAAGEFDSIISAVTAEDLVYYKMTASRLLKKENLLLRLRTELPELFTANENKYIRTVVKPLGTLFHIAAGNMDALPAYSVFEGLITGNVNILKLPQADDGITIKILEELIKLCPFVTEKVAVFDTPSSDVEAMKKLASLSDAVIVWGGDAAVKAVRELAPVNAKLIEWGHRLSFSYISGFENKEAELHALAEHIVSTDQLLCSSCQVIYIDTKSLEDIKDFCAFFLPILEAERSRRVSDDIGAAAEFSTESLCARLENAVYGNSFGKKRKTFRGRNCSLIACTDTSPELSPMFGNVLVKRLPQELITKVLRRSTGVLQTAGLICRENDRQRLTELLAEAGLNRITRAGNMSSPFYGEAHDGEYPLRRYVRIVNIEE